LAPASRASEKKTETKLLDIGDIDFLPPNNVIDELCDPNLYKTNVQLSMETTEKEANEKYRWEFLEKYGSQSGLATDKGECYNLNENKKEQNVFVSC
jgi:hypothetical protein